MKILSILITLSAAINLSAKPLVSSESVKNQIKQTEYFTLKNGIKVIYRKVADSDIIVANVDFITGHKDISPPKSALTVATSLMSKGSKSFPKEALFAELSKYSISFSCSDGLESSNCAINTLNEYFDKSVEIMADGIFNPLFGDHDFQGEIKGETASIKSRISSPESYANSVVNRVFYPKGHPFQSSPEETLEELSKLKLGDIKAIHKRLLKSNMKITVVGSLKTDSLKGILNKYFAGHKNVAAPTKHVFDPIFDPKSKISFENREIPTAYIKIKFNGPSIHSPDNTTATLLNKILDEELSEEVRTKRSLSYSVYSYRIPHSIGIWVMGASTSQPEQTLEAIAEVVERVKNKTYTNDELDEYKTSFITSYYLAQQSHSALASVLSSNFTNFNTANKFYKFPKELDSITPKKIQAAAKKYLKNFRIGVVFDQKKFDSKWSQKFTEKFQEKI